MNSERDSQTVQPTFFAEAPAQGRLIFTLTVPGRLPSWNDILGMEQWARYRFKADLAKGFLSELRRSEGDSLTKTTSAKNTTLIFSATRLEDYLETARQQRALKSRNKKLAKANPKKSESKSLKNDLGPVPF